MSELERAKSMDLLSLCLSAVYISMLSFLISHMYHRISTQCCNAPKSPQIASRFLSRFLTSKNKYADLKPCLGRFLNVRIASLKWIYLVIKIHVIFYSRI